MIRLPLLLLLLAFLPCIHGTVTLSQSGRQYHSRPASFGFELEYGLQYVALLQVVEDDLHLCAGEREVLDEYEDETIQGGEDDDWGFDGIVGHHDKDGGIGLEGVNLMQPPGRRRGLRMGSLPAVGGWNQDLVEEVMGTDGIGHVEAPSGKKNETTKEIHVVPSNGVPVAILAKRGQCTYETKARVASTLTSPHGTVRFLIVYNDDPSDGNHLITMMPKEGREGGRKRRGHDLYKEVGLVFVSYESGVDLREFLNTQPHRVTAAGGPRILLDGTDRWIFPPMDESAAGLAFLLMLFGCVCSLSLLLNTTLYGTGRSAGDSVVNDHHLFLLGPNGAAAEGRPNGTNNARRGNGLRLLTMEEVETLPTREYCGERSPSSSSAGLELRDKSEMPYMAAAGDDDGPGEGHLDASIGNNASGGAAAAASGNLSDDDDHDEECHDAAPGSGGGLCESLLPSSTCKKDDDDEYYFRHNSCSICLDEYQVGEQIRVLPCQHTFHSDCIFPWLTERSPTCPLCKAMFEAVRYEEEGEADEEGGREAGEDEERSVRTEASVPSPGPPLEDEPPVHRRRRQRQRRGRRERQESDLSEGAGVADIGSAESPEGNSEGGQEAEVAPTGERQSSGLRGRLWGLIGGIASSSATTTQTSALEEPLLTSSDDDGNDDDVV